MKEDIIYKDFQSGKMTSVYEYIYPALMSYAMKFLGNDYSFLAEDCVQDSIYKTYINRELICSASQLNAYLYTSVRNKAISILRRGSSKKNFLKIAETYEQELTIGLIEQETMRILFTAIDRLPESYREIVEMSFDEGLKNAEIAKRLGITESAVKKRKSKIIEKLRKQMKDPEKINVVLCMLATAEFI